MSHSWPGLFCLLSLVGAKFRVGAFNIIRVEIEWDPWIDFWFLLVYIKPRVQYNGGDDRVRSLFRVNVKIGL